MRIKIWHKLIAGFIVIFSAFGIAYYSISKSFDEFSSVIEVIRSTSLRTQYVRQFDTLLPQTRFHVERFINDKIINIDQIKSLNHQAYTAFEYLDSSPLRDEERDILRRMQLYFERIPRDLLVLHNRQNNGDLTEVVQSSDRILTSLKVVENSYSQIKHMMRGELDESIGKADVIRQYVQTKVNISAGATLLISILVVWGMLRTINSPIKRLTKATKQIASGNFDHTVTVDSGDELGNLAQSFNKMTERLKSTSEELVSARKYTEDIISSMANMLIVVDSEDNISFVNPAVHSLLNYKEGELINKPFTFIFAQEQRSAANTLMHKIRTASALQDQEYNFVNETGEIIPVSLSAASITNTSIENEEIGKASIVCVAQNLTTHKQLLAETTQQRQRLSSFVKTTGRIVHDLNNLLCAIMGYTSLLKHDLKDQTGALEKLQHIKSSSDRAAGIASELMGLTSTSMADKSEININSIVDRTVEILEGKLAPSNVEIIKSCADDLWIIKGLPALVQQIMINLTINSIDAMPGGGQIILETQNFEADSDFCRQQPSIPQGRYVRLSITDTGEGISEELLSKLYNPYFTTKQRRPGLGLTIVKQLVEQHNGIITIESEKNKGTKAHIYFSLPSQNTQDSLQIVSEVMPAQRIPANTSILIADDEKDMRTLASTVLERYGIRTVCAADGEEAVREFEKNPNVNVILLDYIMPKMSGIEVYEAISASHPNVRVLFSSGYNESEEFSKLKMHNYVGFIHKPYSSTDLLNKISELLLQA